MSVRKNMSESVLLESVLCLKWLGNVKLILVVIFVPRIMVVIKLGIRFDFFRERKGCIIGDFVNTHLFEHLVYSFDERTSLVGFLFCFGFSFTHSVLLCVSHSY